MLYEADMMIWWKQSEKW